MFPVRLHLFGLTMSAHQLLELLAYGLGFQLYRFLRRRWPRGPAMTLEQTAWVVVGAILGALIGAKMLAWVESLPVYWAHLNDWRILIGGKTIVGALLGGWAGVTLAKSKLGIGHPSGDVYVFPVILGMCIGRIGCFLAGLEDHTYGIATRLPWGVDFGDGISRHPTQLYEIAFLVPLAGWFMWRIRTGQQRGCMFSQFLLAYVVFRFFVEFIKPRYVLPMAPLSAIQLTCLAAMVYAVIQWNANCCGNVESAGNCGEVQDPAKFTWLSEDKTSLRTDRPSGESECYGSQDGSPRVVEKTMSLCAQCLRRIEAQVVLEHRNVYLQKSCPEHGPQRVLIATDNAYWQRSRNLYRQAPTSPRQRNTERQHGCPWDCGLCPDHEQHTCLAVVEITERCDLGCPICYAAAEAGGAHRSLAEIEDMLDLVANRESKVGVLQISGGEPALHPDLFTILDRVKARSIRHLMLNTNGRRIAQDEEFVRRLAGYMPGFEIYLQFDSLVPATLQQLRGADLTGLRRQALRMLNRYDLATTLVVMLEKGLNDREIGGILDFAASQPCVRGVTFQPIQAAGRLEGFDPATDRLTLTEVRSAILHQSRLFSSADLVPVPCHPDALTAGYAIRRGGKLTPLSHWVDPQSLLVSLGGNTIAYEQDPNLRQHLQSCLRTSPQAMARKLKLQCCLPLLPAAGSPIQYRDVFRVVIMQFMDAWSMDLRSLKRSCVHIASPAGRLAPFETYNLLHRKKTWKPKQPTTEDQYV
ncbi:MAG: prolipoprotein diacylglyceryl transferase family protein [Verrucomicrobiota bacterium]